MKRIKAFYFYNLANCLCLFLSIFLLKLSSAEDQVTYLQNYCSDDEHYDQGSQFENNLDLLLSNLTSKATTNRFYNFTTGEGTNKVYGLFHCSSVYTNQVCQDCSLIAKGEIQRRCPSNKEAIVWYQQCMLRYANQNIFSIDDTLPFYFLKYGPAKYSQFNQDLTDTIIKLSDQATSGNSSSLSATTVVYLTKYITVTSYVDCTQDLTPVDCGKCLQTGLERVKTDGTQVGVLLQPSCRLMYFFSDSGLHTTGTQQIVETDPFTKPRRIYLLFNLFNILLARKITNSSKFPICYKQLNPGVAKAATNGWMCTALPHIVDGIDCQLLHDIQSTRHAAVETGLYVALAIVSVTTAISFLLNITTYLKRSKIGGNPTGLEEIETMENLQFELNAIRSATDNFSATNKLGQGGFGIIYKGTLADAQAVAVKRLSNTSGQGIREFKTEACLAAKLQHKNLVKLYGFCLERDEMLLIYEFVPNKSLDRHLFDPKRSVHLKWGERYKIIMGIARGLLYLHEDSRPKIIHRDLKPGNILLDREMSSKIADFGMAKLFGGDQTQGNTSRVAGSFGYMAPEYASTGHFSVKSDIFSFGVILLEVVSGLRNNTSDLDIQDENLLNYAWRLWDEGSYLKLLDPALGNDLSRDEVERCIHVGLLCVQEEPAKRPNIASVLSMLSPKPISLSRPEQPPPFPFRPENKALSHGSYSVQAEDTISELLPR